MALLVMIGVFVMLGAFLKGSNSAGGISERREIERYLANKAKGAEGDAKTALVEAYREIKEGKYADAHKINVEQAAPTPFEFDPLDKVTFQVKLGRDVKGVVMKEDSGKWAAYSLKNTSKPIGKASSRESAAELLGY